VSEIDRAAFAKRVERAKKISSALLPLLNSSKGLLIPPELRAALGDLAWLVVELAQLSHAQFDMSPHDLAGMSHRLDALEGLTGDGGGVPQLRRRIEALEKEKIDG